MKKLTRSQWIDEEIQPLLNGNVKYIKLLLYPKEMRNLKKKNPKLHYNGKAKSNRKKSDMRMLYTIEF